MQPIKKFQVSHEMKNEKKWKIKFNKMIKKIISIVAILFSISTFTYGQVELNPTVLRLENDGSIIVTLTEDQLKLNASDIDLISIQVQNLADENGILPDILVPTSHANLYAIIDFSNCFNGTYSITGSRGQEKLRYTIILKKD